MKKYTKILVVDDQKWIRVMLLEALTLSGFISFGAANYNDALELAYREMPDIALVDINIPENSGFKLLPRLKKLKPDVEVVFMSGSSDFGYKEKASLSGAIGFFVKPFDIFELVTFLNGISTTMDLAAKGEGEWEMEHEKKRI